MSPKFSLAEDYIHSLTLAAQYDGREDSYETLAALLITIEKRLIDVFLGKINSVLEGTLTSLSESDELTWTKSNLPQDIQKTYEELEGISIGTILLHASNTFSRRYRNVTEGTVDEALETSGIFQVRLKEVHLIPNEESRPMRSLDGKGEWKEQQFLNRIFPLITFLQQHEIYTDDLLLWRGVTMPGQMRRIPYILLEIPRIHKQILVCNLVGEATFVMKSLFAPKYFSEHTKESLIDNNPGEVVRIEHRNDQQWLSEIATALFDEWNDVAPTPKEKKEKGKKWTAEMIFQLKEMIREKHTFEKWMELNSTETPAYRCNGLSLAAIHNILLGVVRNSAYSSISRLRMALIIWPERKVEIQEWIDARNPEKLPGILQKSGMTFEQWMKMSNTEASAYRCKGLSMLVMHTILLGVAQANSYTSFPRLHMAEMIWPERKEEIRAWIDARIPEKLPGILQKSGMTYKKWMGMTSTEASVYKCNGLSMQFLHKILLGIAKEDAYGYLPRLHIAEMIWPERKEEIRALIDTQNAEKLPGILKKSGMTFEQWMGMSNAEAGAYQYKGLSMPEICTILLGEATTHANYTLPRLHMAEMIWPERKEEIRALMNTKNSEKLSRVFQKSHITSKEDIQAWIDAQNAEKLPGIIQKSGMTYEKWMRMSNTEAQAYRCYALSMGEIHNILIGEVKANAYASLPRLQMAVIIWPEKNEEIRALIDAQNSEKLSRVFQKSRKTFKEDLQAGIDAQNAEKLPGILQKSGMTYEKWMGMSNIEARAYRGNRLSVREIYTILIGEVNRDAYACLPRLQMAGIIWPERNEEIRALMATPNREKLSRVFQKFRITFKEDTQAGIDAQNAEKLPGILQKSGMTFELWMG